MARLDEMLTYLKEHDCSDLHLTAGREPRGRAHGKLRTIEGKGVMSDEELRGMMRELAAKKHWAEYESTQDVDFAYGLEGVAGDSANNIDRESGG